MKSFIALCGLCLLPLLSWSKVTVELPKEALSVDRPFTVSFDLDGQSNKAMPDFSPLERDFQILGTAKSSQISVVDSQVTSQTTWQLTLQAKRAGQLALPKIDFGQSSSKPTYLNVAKATPIATQSDDAGLIMIADTDTNKPYVQQQITYRVKMYYRVQPVSGNFSPPAVSQGQIEALGDSRNYPTTRNGIPYQVVEQDYAIFAEKPGAITVEAPIFKGFVTHSPLTQSNDPFLLSHYKPVQLSAKTVHLTVQPIPASYPKTAPFLPASELTLSEKWKGLGNSLSIGEPITRLVTIKADGLMANQLPDLKLKRIQGLNHYTQPAKQNNQLIGHRVVGSKQFKVVYIPDSAGDMTLPAINITWWDSNKQQLTQAKLPAKSLHVPGQQSPVSTAPTGPPLNPKPTPKVTPIAAAQPQSTTPHRYNWQIILPWLLLLVVILAWLAQRLRTSTSGKVDRLSSQPNNGTDKTVHYAAVIKGLKQACMANQPKRSQSMLLDWGRYHWSAQNIMSLGHLVKAVDDSAFTTQIDALEKALYHPQSHQWQGKALWSTLVIIEARLKKTRRKKPLTVGHGLPPFNPT